MYARIKKTNSEYYSMTVVNGIRIVERVVCVCLGGGGGNWNKLTEVILEIF